jgi:hypothetical protein
MATYNQNFTFTGLGTLSTSLPIAGPYFVDGKITVPTIVSGGVPSQLVVTINQNGSPIYVGPAGAEGFHVDLLGAVNDTLAVVFSSSLASDALINTNKAVIAIGSGM